MTDGGGVGVVENWRLELEALDSKPRQFRAISPSNAHISPDMAVG